MKPKISLLLVILIAALPLFAHLDSIPMHVWDESRLAENTLEMRYDNNWIVTHYNGAPDMWNTKPPFLIWVQVLSTKIFGNNELGVRLPSALAAMLTCLLLWWFFTKKYGEPLLGFIVPAILVCVHGYIVVHGTRTGDYDAMLTLFTTGYALFYFLYLNESNKKYLRIAIGLLILAALTKGVQSLIFLPALLIYTVYKKKAISLLKQRDLYIGIAAFLIVVVGYYLLRDHYNPGYIKAVQENELGGRYSKTIENHAGDVWTNYDLLIKEYFTTWYLMVLPGILCGLLSKKKWLQEMTIFTTVLALFYFLVISSAATQIWWYIMPLYPLLAVIVGIFVYTLCSLLIENIAWKSVLSYNPLPYVLLFFVLVMPYSTSINTALDNKLDGYLNDEDRGMTAFMNDVVNKRRNIDGYTIVNDNFNPSIYWFTKVVKYENRPIKFEEKDQIVIGSRVIAYTAENKKYIEEHYAAHAINTFQSVTIYNVDGRKQ